MTTFHIKSGGCNVPVNLPEGFPELKLTGKKSWQDWIAQVNKTLDQQKDKKHPNHKDPYKLHGINVEFADKWGDRVGFIKMTANISNSERKGKPLPGSMLMRGSSVGMLVVLIPEDPVDQHERYVLLTVQARVPAASLAFVELPAGMVDEEKIKVKVGSKEINEELHLDIKPELLDDLTEMACQLIPEDSGEDLEKAMFPSAGGCDESITILSCERKVSRAQLKEWDGKRTGNKDEGEDIALKVVPMKHLWRYGARDAKALAAMALWTGLRAEGKLPSMLDTMQFPQTSQQVPEPASKSS